jgi:hypothetical protein
MNLSQLQIKVRRSLWAASNRRLTVLQRAQFFNKFIVPKFIHLAKVFPLPKKKLIDMQKACSKFIWKKPLGADCPRAVASKVNGGGTRSCNSGAQMQSPNQKAFVWMASPTKKENQE